MIEATNIHFQFHVNSDAFTLADCYQKGVISALSVIAAKKLGIQLHHTAFFFCWTESDLRIHKNDLLSKQVRKHQLPGA